MKLTRLAVNRPVGVSMAVLALITLAFVAIQGLGVDLLPNMEFPYVAVVTAYPGADPESVELDVTKPMEEAVATVAGIRRLTSQSHENLSFVLAEFAWGADVESALRQVETNVAAAANLLPDQAIAPVVIQADPSQLPAMLIAVSSPQDPVALTHAVETLVKPRLERLDGVAAVSLLGGAREEVSVRYDSEALRELGVTPTLLYSVLAYQNVVVPAGVVTEDGVRYQIKAGNRIDTLEALRNQPLTLREPAPSFGLLPITASLPVRLREVADVEIMPEPREGATEVNGNAALIMRVLKRPNESSLTISSRVRAALESIADDPNLDFTFHVLTDQADLIRHSLVDVGASGAMGGLLALLMLFAFFRRLVPLAVVATAIPLSILGALAIMRMTGSTLNLMSLGGLSLAIGMVVDNAIILIENILRLWRAGLPPRQAAEEGSAQIASAVVAATVTTVVVFLPIGYVQSLAGQLFKEMGIAVSAALFSSMVVALIVVPAAASRWLRQRRSPRVPQAVPLSSFPALEEAAAAAEDEPTGSDKGASEPGLYARLQKTYALALDRWLDQRWPTFVLAAVFAAALVMLPRALPAEFLPPMDGGVITFSLDLPPGSGVQQTLDAGRSLAQTIQSWPEVETVALLTGDQGAKDVFSLLRGSVVNRADLTVVLRPRNERSKSAFDISEAIQSLPRPEGSLLRIQADRTTAALGDDFFPGLTLQFFGPDLAVLETLVEEAQEKLRLRGGFGAALSDASGGAAEIYFEVTERSFQGVLAGGQPLTAGQVGLALRNHMTGMTATHVTLDGRRLPVVLRPQVDESGDLEAVKGFRIPGAELTGSSAQPILERVSRMHHTQSPATIHHLNRERVITLRAPLDGISLSEAKKIADETLADLSFPAGYRGEVAGIHAAIADSQAELSQVVVIALLLVYIAMAIQFESVLQPIIIMTTVPLAAVGALGSLRLFGFSLSVPSLIGLVLLFGIAVNNGIVMIDYINQLRRRGANVREAVVQGASVRLRPILMTALTTILALVPLAVGRGNGSEFQAPMATAVIGGLIASTAVSLFLIPGLVLFVGQRSLRTPSPAQATSLLSALALAFAIAQPAEAASIRWEPSVSVGVAFSEGNSPMPAVGAGVSAIAGGPRLRLGVAAGIAGPTPPIVADVSGGFGGSRNRLGADLALRAALWLSPAAGAEIETNLAWWDDRGRRAFSIVYGGGTRGVHPTAGRFPVPPGWQFSGHWDQVIQPDVLWERDIAVRASPDSPPVWTMTAGTSWQGDVAQTWAHAGLLLHESGHAPLFRLGLSLGYSRLQELRLAIAPTVFRFPLDWPVLSLSYAWNFSFLKVKAQHQWINHGSSFSTRHAAQLASTLPFSVLLSWSVGDALSGVVAVSSSF